MDSTHSRALLLWFTLHFYILLFTPELYNKGTTFQEFNSLKERKYLILKFPSF